MDAQFWLERWRDGRTHFHQNRITPLLQKYWPTLSLPHGAKVFVPLCGKSLDMLWIADQGHYVLGSELSAVAVEQFFAENGLQAKTHDTAAGRHYTAGNIEIICGDVFDVNAATLSDCTGVYDRAALVALPADMRQRYADHVYAQLSPQYHGLLLTLDYVQAEMEGPPFAVGDAEVQSLYAPHSCARLIDRRGILDKEPKFAERGLTRLDTLVYSLSRKA